MNGEFEFGVSKHTWNDWFFLAEILRDHYINIPEEGKGSFGKTDNQLIQKLRDHYEGEFDKHLGWIYGKDIVRPYCDRLNLKPEELTQSRLDKINSDCIQRGFIKSGESGLKVEAVKKVDVLARKCNNSILTSIYQGLSLEWKNLHEFVAEAGRIIYGEEKGTFLDSFCPLD